MGAIKAYTRHAGLQRMLVILTASACSTFTLAQTNQRTPKPVVTRQTSFMIPFHVRPATQQGQEASEVQLHLSDDRGVTWRLHSRQHPSANSFHFRAQGDGEYLFAVRTVDRSGRALPRSPLAAELSVVVDTVPPRLSLFADVGTAGEIQTRWEASDDRLDAESMVVEFRSGPGAEWRNVAVDSNSNNQSVLSGQAHWFPGTDQQRLLLRAQVKDKAGNTATVQRQLDLPSLAARGDTTPRLANNSTRPDGGIAWPSAETRSRLAHRDDSPNRQDGASPNSPDPWNARPGERGRGLRPATDPGHDRPSPIGSTTKNPLPGQHRFQPNGDPKTAGHFASDSRVAQQNSTVHLPHGVIPILSQSRHLTLDYDIDSVGPSGVRSVQLWATPDGGNNWTKSTEDEDRRSPVDVEIDREGVYGFVIIVENNEGLSASVPQPGDVPDFWVAVDETKPYVELTSAAYGTGAKVGRLEIRWKASDDFLIDRPVTLKFTSDPSSGWQSIANNISNAGKYSWRVDRHIPQEVYLRIEVLDRAGNLGVHELSEPVSTRGLVPKARIRGVRPLPQANVRGIPSNTSR